ncbi:MAG TPA: hypothetical protein VKP69_33670, partial [Isosphaeraceae bacterium]|nr:hypothetical protein [Isosphaeraceae bacterium]
MAVLVGCSGVLAGPPATKGNWGGGISDAWDTLRSHIPSFGVGGKYKCIRVGASVNPDLEEVSIESGFEAGSV